MKRGFDALFPSLHEATWLVVVPAASFFLRRTHWYVSGERMG
jgi:hypothetical protein